MLLHTEIDQPVVFWWLLMFMNRRKARLPTRVHGTERVDHLYLKMATAPHCFEKDVKQVRALSILCSLLQNSLAI